MNVEDRLGQSGANNLGTEKQKVLPKVGDVVVEKGDWYYAGGSTSRQAGKDITVQPPSDPAYW